MKRLSPPREPHVLALSTPYAAAKALECLTWSAVRCETRAGLARLDSDLDAVVLAEAAARMCASRAQMLGYELVAPYGVACMPARMALTGDSHAADVALVRGWRKGRPQLLARLAL